MNPLFRKKASTQNLDPDLAQFQRAMEAIEAGPTPGKEGVGISGAQLEQIRTWMQQRFDSGDYASVWERRVALGYSLTQDGAPAETWYWVNALPALAALRLDNRDHPFVATAAGFADQVYWGLSERTAAIESTNTEIQQRFFG